MHKYETGLRARCTVLLNTLVASVMTITNLLPMMTGVHRSTCLQCFDAVGWVTGRASGL